MNWSFYRRVEVLNRAKHANLRLQLASDIRYASGLRDCPIVADEFLEAAKTYPIVFSREASGQLVAVVVLGFPGTGNLWIDESGHWRPVNYVPAYVRRYPFIVVESEGEFLIGLDMDFEGLGTQEGEPLFQADGSDGAFLANAGSFIEEYLAGLAQTRVFLNQLERLDLLQPFNAEVLQKGQEPSLLQNMLCIDKTRLDNLSACELVDFVRGGHYALALAHLASLTNFSALSALMAPVHTPEAG